VKPVAASLDTVKVLLEYYCISSHSSGSTRRYEKARSLEGDRAIWMACSVTVILVNVLPLLANPSDI
jgi:hypothetical protein